MGRGCGHVELHVNSSALPLIVRGLDRAGKGDDIRRENLNEKAVFARSRPTLGGHAVVEHPEEGRFAARDRVLHLLLEPVAASGAGGALADLAEPNVGLPGRRDAVRARKAHTPLIGRQSVEEEGILQRQVPWEGLRRRAHEILKELVIDPYRTLPRDGRPNFTDGREGEQDDDGEDDLRVRKIAPIGRSDPLHSLNDERWPVPRSGPDAGTVRNARVRISGLLRPLVGQRKFLREGVHAGQLDRRHVAVIARLMQVAGQLRQHVRKRLLVAGIPGRRHRNVLARLLAAVVRHLEIEAPEAQAQWRPGEQPFRGTLARRDREFHSQMVQSRCLELAVDGRKIVGLERGRYL